jgi:hypothetical protein
MLRRLADVRIWGFSPRFRKAREPRIQDRSRRRIRGPGSAHSMPTAPMSLTHCRDLAGPQLNPATGESRAHRAPPLSPSGRPGADDSYGDQPIAAIYAGRAVGSARVRSPTEPGSSSPDTSPITNRRPRQRPARNAPRLLLQGCGRPERQRRPGGRAGSLARALVSGRTRSGTGRTQVPAAWREQVGALAIADTGGHANKHSRPIAVAEPESGANTRIANQYGSDDDDSGAVLDSG